MIWMDYCGTPYVFDTVEQAFAFLQKAPLVIKDCGDRWEWWQEADSKVKEPQLVATIRKPPDDEA